MLLLDKLLWQMEMRLHQPVALGDLAKACAISPYYMARSFRMATGMAPMTYLRARRLSVAASALASGEDDILNIALTAQYNSHEAFTRAFASYFGVLPNTIRRARSTETLSLMEPLKMQKELIVEVATPQLKTRPGFRVIGLAAQCSFEDTSPIPQLWQGFSARENELTDKTELAGFGVCCDADSEGHFRYIAGAAVPMRTSIPNGMSDVVLPEGRYAIFIHSGHIADFGKTVYTIWNKALPDAGLEPRNAPNFELYDQRFNARTGRGDVEIWIPVADIK